MRYFQQNANAMHLGQGIDSPAQRRIIITATTTTALMYKTIIEQRMRHLINQNYLFIDRL